MGKWTSAKFDSTLTAKMKSLVTGAIERSKLEKKEQCISFEHFVEDLDVGDSFTTTLVDILVQELADRVSRTGARDKASISEHTARSLRLLANPARQYRGGNSRMHRRAVNAHQYLHGQVPPLEIDEESEIDWFDAVRVPPVDSSTSALYDAMGGTWTTVPQIGGIQMRESSPERSTPGIENAPSPTPQPVPVSSTRFLEPQTWRANELNPPSLSDRTGARRRASTMRPGRSRPSDFSEFTSHRRSRARDSTQPDQSGSVDEPVEIEYSGPVVDTAGAMRRFFPLGNSSGRWPSSWSESPPSRADLGQSPSPRPWSPPSIAEASSTSGSMSVHLPRLRRGGVRAPEALRRRDSSPVVPAHSTVQLSSLFSPSPSAEPQVAVPQVVASGSHLAIVEYPTPTSTDHE